MPDHINVAIIEPSIVIYEGLSNILLKSGKYFQIYRLENLEEIENSIINKKLNAVIVNPVFLQNRIKEFAGIKRKQNNIYWIGLVYSYYDNEVLTLLDNVIHINDTPDSIVTMVHKLIIKDNKESAMEEHLSERETDVLKLLVKGLSNKEIADKLNISIHTVISHRKNISAKTGIKSQSGLTIYSLNNKIISLDDFSDNLI